MTPWPKAAAALAVATAACLLFAVAWWWMSADDDAAAPSVAEQPPSPRRAAARPAPAIAAAQAAAAPVIARGPEQIEFCGIGWVDSNAEDGGYAATAASAALAAARGRLVRSMQGSGDEYAQAVGLWLASGEVGDTTSRPSADALAQRAAASHDPRVYAMAFRSCTSTPHQGSCALLSAAQWAQIDEGNAAPWLFILNAATERKDRAAADDALFHIGSAARFADRPFTAMEAIASSTGAEDIDVAAAYSSMIGALGMAAAWTLPLPALGQACTGASLQDANRHQACQAAYATLANRSDSLLVATIGAGAGARLGAPLAWLDRARALQQATMDALPNEGQVGAVYSCEGMRRAMGRLARQAVIGEVELGRESLASQGRRLDDEVALQRAKREQREVEAAAQRASQPASQAATPYSATPPPAR